MNKVEKCDFFLFLLSETKSNMKQMSYVPLIKGKIFKDMGGYRGRDEGAVAHNFSAKFCIIIFLRILSK